MPKPTSFKIPSSRIRLAAVGIYSLAALVALIVWRAFWSPDIIFLALVVLFFILGCGKKFFRDFAPFIVLLISYDAFRGFADLLNHNVHYTEMIRVDTWLGAGTLPTVQLQHWLFHGQLHWYDFYFYSLYMVHFLVPLGLAAFIWLWRRAVYWQYVVTFLVLSYLGFLTYLLFPAAPPWMATKANLIPHLDQLSNAIWASFGVHSFPTVYSNINPNPVAAVPSLHVAYPVLAFMFGLKIFGKRALPLIIYPLSVAFGVVYLGEHYVIDGVLGAAYAIGTYVGVAKLYAIRKRRKSAKVPASKPAANPKLATE